MAKDILIREQEFLKMNEELDKKTKSFIEKSTVSKRSTPIASSSRHQSPKKSFISSTSISKSPPLTIPVNNQQLASFCNKTIIKPFPKKSNTIPRQYRDVLTARKPIKDCIKKPLNIDIELYGNVKLPISTTRNMIKSEQQTETILSKTTTTTTPGTTKIIHKLFQDKSILGNHQRNETLSKSPEKPSIKTTKLLKNQSAAITTISPSKIKSSSNKTTPIQSPKKQQQTKNISVDYLKSLNTETNEILEETFRNRKFSCSISSENLADSKNDFGNDDKKCINNKSIGETTARSEASTATNTMESHKSNGRTTFPTSTWKSNTTYKTDDSSPTTTTGVKKNLSPNGLVKFLNSKVQLLQEELETSANLILKRNKELEKSYEQQKKLEKQRDQAISKNNSLTEQYEILEEKLKNTNKISKEYELQYKLINREMDNNKRELKILQQQNTNLEKRLYRSNEDLDNMKIQLSQYENNEREVKESTRIEKETINKQIKQLKKQRLELIGAYKKQLYLIDNLKRQNICMEQSKMIGFGEKEFTKVLEWNNNTIKK